MTRAEKLQTIKSQREFLLKELEAIYLNAFNRIANLDLSDSDIAKLSQIFLQSKEGSLKPLQKEIEKPLITKAPDKDK